MNWWRELRNKLSFRSGRAFDDELDSEIRFHLESRAEELMAAGVPAREARAQAQREFGSRTRAHEDSRAAWQVQWLEDLFSDLSYGIRALRRSPGFVVAAVLSLALGIGANTTIFSLTNEFLFSQPACSNCSALKYVLVGGNSHSELTEYRFLRDSHFFAGVAGSNVETEANWRNGERAERIWAANVTSNFFDVVGIPVALGRPIHAGEQNELVLNYSFWKGKLGGDPEVVGRRLVLDGQAYTVTGVLPPNHRTLTGFGLSPDLYKTFSEAHFPLMLYVRLRRGMSHAEAYAHLQQLCQQLDHVYPNPDLKRTEGLEVRAVAGFERLRSLSMLPLTAFFGMLMVVVGLVLLIACANVASLLLARATSRQRELAVRQAIGAGRSRIVRQLLAESLLLAGLGTAAGLVLNFAASTVMNGFRLPLPVPLRLHIEPDWRLLSYSCALAIASALICGLIPALRATRRDLNHGLKIEERSTAGGRSRIQRLLVGGQLAVSVLLLIVALLFVKNLLLAAGMSPGFDVHHTVWAYMRLVPEKHATREQIDPTIRAALEKLRSLPGVQSAATLRIVPFNDQQTMGTDARLDGGAKAEMITYTNNAVGPDYFKTMRIPLISGREFLLSDTRSAPPVVIVNSSLAHRLFEDKNPVGHTIRLHSGPPTTIVGVAKDSKYFTMGERDVSGMYSCYFQGDLAVVNLNFVVRSGLPPANLVKPISSALAALDSTAAIEVKPMEKAMALAMLPSQIGAALLGSMGVLALLLASVGLYGVLLYSVTRRLREFGVRMALGAARGKLINLVLWDSVWMVSGGVAAGMLLAFIVTPLLTLFLVPEVGVHDFTAFASTLTALMSIAAIASVSPALRALRVDPVVVLRYD